MQHRFLHALARQPVDRTPVWIMRQAGRYLPEYRALRARAGSFLKLCKTPELACEVTLQPLQRFDVDAAIIFSDILTIPDALGFGLAFTEGEGPRLETPPRTVKEIQSLEIPCIESALSYVFEAIRLVKAALKDKVPLIGFCGSPWTVATYVLEDAKRWRYMQPEAVHHLLGVLTQVSITYLRAQSAAGADCLMIFDTWGSLLSQRDYQEFSLAYMHAMVKALEDLQKPVILFTKGGGLWLEDMAATGCAGLGIDWTCSLKEARLRTHNKVALQGNLDPTALFAPRKAIAGLVGQVLEDYGQGPGHIFNLGHGINKEVDPENVQAMIEAIAQLSPRYVQSEKGGVCLL